MARFVTIQATINLLLVTKQRPGKLNACDVYPSSDSDSEDFSNLRDLKRNKNVRDNINYTFC